MSELEQGGKENYDPLDKVRKLGEQFANRLTLDNLRLSECYLEGGEIEILLLFTSPGRHDGSWLVAALSPPLPPDFEPKGVGEGGGTVHREELHSDARSLHLGHGNHQQAVLVKIVQLGEGSHEFVPAVVRLGGLDVSRYFAADALYMSKRRGFVFLRSGANWILGPHGRNTPARFDQLPDQVVERAPEVVDSIPGDKRDASRDLRKEFDHADLLARVRVILEPRSIIACFEEPLPLGLEITDVLFGPFGLPADAGESVGGG